MAIPTNLIAVMNTIKKKNEAAKTKQTFNLKKTLSKELKQAYAKKEVKIATPPVTKLQFNYGSMGWNLVNPVNLLNNYKSLVLGTKEEKGLTATKMIGVEFKSTLVNGKTKVVTLEEITKDVITKQKQDPELKKEWENRTLSITDIKIPEIKFPDLLAPFKEAGKWVLIAGIGLIAFLIIMRRK